MAANRANSFFCSPDNEQAFPAHPLHEFMNFLSLIVESLGVPYLPTSPSSEMLNSREDIKGICEVANDNAEGQIIISGDKLGIISVQKFLKDKKIKNIPLKVSAPFHCSLMKPAANVMKEKIEKVNFKKPIFKIVNNVTADPEDNPETLKKLLIDQIFSTVRWRESLVKISKNGVKNFVEIGPGKVLTGMAKRTVKGANYFSINSLADIKNFINEFKK